jgi:hypothetical protein
LESLPTVWVGDAAKIWPMSVQSSAGQSGTSEIAAPGAPAPGRRRIPGRRQAGLVAAYALPFVVFFTLCVALSRTVVMDSDAADNALQGLALLHGHLLLHGWIIGDATYYTFELPLYALLEAVLGFHPLTTHIEAAAAFTIVAILAAAIAKHRARGVEGAVRIGIVLALLVAAMDSGADYVVGQNSGLSGPVLLLAEPNHTGTCVFLLASILLLQRKPSWRATPWLLLVILALGQLDDATVRYLFVGSVLVVFGWRAIAAREWRGRDAVIAFAALCSVPGSLLLRKALLALGAYTMVPAPTAIAGPGQWFGHLKTTVEQIPQLFGADTIHGLTTLELLCFAISVLAIAAVAYGFLRGLFTWFRADPTDQLLVLGILAYLGGYIASTEVGPTNLHEFSGVLPVLAALAARQLPARLAGYRAALPVVALAALIPMVAGVATRPVTTSPSAALASWLEAHNLHYGIAGYWEASSVTLASGNAVQVRAVLNNGSSLAEKNWETAADLANRSALAAYNWETQTSWYDPKINDATFLISNYQDPGDWYGLDPASVESILGKPTTVAQVGSYEVMIYSYNLLDRVIPANPIPHSE